MADTLPQVDQQIRPLQNISWAEKMANNKIWFKQNSNYYIHKSNFNFGQRTNGRKDLRLFYEVYNNQFPAEWFSHITNPLSAKKAAHKAFPAKVRPVSILRTNIDLLLGEYPRRPFIYNVENLGEDGYNSMMDAMIQKVHSNMVQHFTQTVLQQAQAAGHQLSPDQLQQLQQTPPLPDQVKEDFQKSYKDAIASKGNKWLKRIIREKDMKKKLHRMFKDWLIAGQCYSYRGVFNDDLIYRKISPLNIDYDKSPDVDFIEDGEWVTARYMMVLSDVVDQFYDSLTADDSTLLEKQYLFQTPMGFYDHLQGIYTDPNERNKIPVYHTVWKGRKMVKFITYLDPETMQLTEKEVDEDYKSDPQFETVETKWVNEVYETWRVGKDIFPVMQAIPVQRNEMNNCSSCKLPYNGRKYSDTHSDNISLLEMGIPFQIMYIIITYILEKTIAKSKGKIVLIDQNMIPNTNGWDDEKTFYYAEAMGYFLINRNQVGVDKSMNQYSVLDMSLFDQIKQLIELQDYFKQQWDDMTGINRQRKGETYASDGQGVNERAVFQSSVMTDMIFIGFEEFVERELQSIMDYAKFLTNKGKKWLSNSSDFDKELAAIDPEDFATAELGVFVDGSSEHMRKLQALQALAQSMLQNNTTPSTVASLINADNMADILAKLKQAEEIEQSIIQQTAQSEQQHEQDMEELKQRFASYQEMLDEKLMNATKDREEDIEYIKGTFSTYTAKDETGDKDNNGVPDAVDVANIESDRKKNEAQRQDMLAQRGQRNRELDMKQQELMHNMEMDKKEHGLKQSQLKLANRKLSIDARKKKTQAK